MVPSLQEFFRLIQMAVQCPLQSERRPLPVKSRRLELRPHLRCVWLRRDREAAPVTSQGVLLSAFPGGLPHGNRPLPLPLGMRQDTRTGTA